MDTDKMTDLKALIIEKSQELYTLCVDNQINCAIVISEIIATHHMVIPESEQINGKVNMNALGYRTWMGMMNWFILQISMGYLAILPNYRPIEGEEWKQ